jgi:hypothetical protein
MEGWDMDINELLDSAQRAQKSVPICLRNDLLEDFEAAEIALAAATAADEMDGSLAGKVSQKIAAAEKVKAISDQMRAATLTLRLRGVPRLRLSVMYAEHPPREGDARDRVNGFNRDTFFEALARECVYEPALSDDQWGRLLDAMSPGQWDALATAAWETSNPGVDVPFSLAASLVLSSTEPASERPTGSASVSSGSTAGSPSRRTPMTTKAGSSPRARKANGTKNSKL